MRKVLFCPVIILAFFMCKGQSNTWSVKFSDAIISRYQPTVNAMTSKGWEYSNGIILHGMEKVYNQTNDQDYLNYIKAYVDTYVDASGNVSDLGKTVDKIQPGMLCLFLYEKTGQIRYKNAAINIKNYLFNSSNFYRTPDGGFWHKSEGTTTSYTYYHVMMVDGMYMLHPFLTKFAYLFNEPSLYDEVTFQLLYMGEKVMPSPATLPRHAWEYYDYKTWSDPVTHQSTDVWSRGTGWYMMALADVLEFLPPTHEDYNNVLNLFQRMASGVASSQHAGTGLWYQVMDKPSVSGNWLETSGSAMFVYALKKGIDMGLLNSSVYLPVCQAGWAGLQTQIANYTDNMPQIRQFCVATGVVNNTTAYINLGKANCPAPTGTQHPHGYCGILMAASEMEFPLPNQNPTISISSPAIGAVYQNPASIQITATASDGDGTISKVEFFSNNSKIGEDLSSPYSFSWENAGIGNYSLTAKAIDNSSGETVSSTVTIQVIPGAYSLNRRIGLPEDDAEEFSDGSVTRSSYKLELSYYSSFAGDQLIGLRFNNISIPAGATITRAYLQFNAAEINRISSGLILKGEKSLHSQPFSLSAHNLSGRQFTGSQVVWNPQAWIEAGEEGAAQASPDIKSIIQEIIQTPGWASGNSVSIFISGSGTRKAVSYETDAQKAALLVIEYQY